MNKQKIYNRVRKHLLTQGEKSGYVEKDYDDQEQFECTYREYDPKRKKVLKCAIGCLIPFRNYSPSLEANNVYNGDVQDALPKSLRIKTDQDFEFLADLQAIHDNREPRDWCAELDTFADRHGLDTAVLD